MTPELWLIATLLVLSPAILYGIALVIFAVYRGKCSACGKRGLNCVESIRATIVVNGKRAPDSWSFYVCGKCGAAFKSHQGEWSRITQSELERELQRHAGRV
jgi:hypothetical protein